MTKHALLECEVTAGGLRIGATLWSEAPTLDEIRAVLGCELRVHTGPTPAPVGYRNNHRHAADQLGVTCLDHHSTLRVTEITFVFVPEDYPADPPARPFEGKLTVWGHLFKQGMLERECAALPVERYLAGLFHGGVGDYPVHMQFEAPRHARTRRRTGQRRLVSVSIGFPDDHH